MEKMNKKQASYIVEALCGSNRFFISEYVQKAMKAFLGLSTTPDDRRYVVLSIEDDLGGQTILDYEDLRQKVIDAGFIPLESPNEAVRYALEHWNELQEAGFRFLSSSAPSVRVGDCHRFVYADLDDPNPYLDDCDVRCAFYSGEAVLAYAPDF